MKYKYRAEFWSPEYVLRDIMIEASDAAEAQRKFDEYAEQLDLEEWPVELRVIDLVVEDVLEDEEP